MLFFFWFVCLFVFAELKGFHSDFLPVNIHCKIWCSFKLMPSPRKRGLMSFSLTSFQWRIWRGMTAARRGPTWCPRTSSKSWKRRTRLTQLSRPLRVVAYALAGWDRGLKTTGVLLSLKLDNKFMSSIISCVCWIWLLLNAS